MPWSVPQVPTYLMKVLTSSVASHKDFTPAHHSVKVTCGASIVATSASPGSMVSEALLAMDIASFSYLFVRRRTSWECTKMRRYCRVQRVESIPAWVERRRVRWVKKRSLRAEVRRRTAWRRWRGWEDIVVRRGRRRAMAVEERDTVLGYHMLK